MSICDMGKIGESTGLLFTGDTAAELVALMAGLGAGLAIIVGTVQAAFGFGIADPGREGVAKGVPFELVDLRAAAEPFAGRRGVGFAETLGDSDCGVMEPSEGAVETFLEADADAD